jgi:hypothetical protein
MRQKGPSAPSVVPAQPAHHVGRTGSGTRRPDPTSGAVAHARRDRPARSTPLAVERPATTPATTADHRPAGWVLVLGLGGLVLPFAALALEVVSGTYANSSVPDWAEWVPLAWPQPLRVAWWLTVAAAAFGFRWSLARLELRPSRVVTVLTVAPFVAFATGIAVGADWATWH